MYLVCILSVLYLNLRRFLRRRRRFLRRVLRDCIAVCAVASQLHRRRIGASHRRRIASLHEMQGTSLKLHSSVVQPTRCTRTEDVDPEQRVLGEASMRTHVEVMVERL
jgi:hypothetical protein